MNIALMFNLKAVAFPCSSDARDLATAHPSVANAVAALMLMGQDNAAGLVIQHSLPGYAQVQLALQPQAAPCVEVTTIQRGSAGTERCTGSHNTPHV